jgi:hypothetical protein
MLEKASECTRVLAEVTHFYFPSRGSRVRVPFPAPSQALGGQALARDIRFSLNASSGAFCYPSFRIAAEKALDFASRAEVTVP